METVMDWSVTHGYRLDNPARRALLRVLPPVNRLVKHHEALPYDQVPGALAKVKEYTANPLTKLAFEFLVLTAARFGEGSQLVRDSLGCPYLGHSCLSDEDAATPQGSYVGKSDGNPD